jgi:hypothetical protein
VTANVGSINSGSTAVPLVAGSYSVFGVSYNYRSAQLWTSWTFTQPSYLFSVTATDAAGNSRVSTDYPVTSDNVAPSGTDVQTANGTGTLGKPDAGDVLTLMFSETIDPWSVMSGWTGGTTNVVVRINDGGSADDTLTVYDSTNTTQMALGSVDLASKSFVTSNVTFGASGTPSTIVQNAGDISVTLGTPSASASQVTTNSRITWTPSSSATDRAGNAMSTTVVTSSQPKGNVF